MRSYEFALVGGKHEPGDLKTQFTLPSLNDDTPQIRHDSTAFWIVSAILQSITSAHAVLDTFGLFPAERLRHSPSGSFVRAFHALILLLRLLFYVWTSHLDEDIPLESMKIDFYMDMMARMLEETSESGKFGIPTHWRTVLEAKLRPWYQKLRDRMDVKSKDADLLGASFGAAGSISTGPDSTPISWRSSIGALPAQEPVDSEEWTGWVDTAEAEAVGDLATLGNKLPDFEMSDGVGLISMEELMADFGYTTFQGFNDIAGEF